MKPLMKIGYLITQHDSTDVSFTNCKGCHICDEITRIRKSIDPDSNKNVRKRKVKPKPKKTKQKYNISKEEIYDCIMQGMSSRQIAKKINVPRCVLSPYISKEFPNYKELKLEATKKNLEMFSKDAFTYEIYQEMKRLNISNDDIAAHYGITRTTLDYRIRRLKNQHAPRPKKQNQPTPKERIDSLIQENAELELQVYERDLMIQRLKDQLAEMERNSQYRTVG